MAEVVVGACVEAVVGQVVGKAYSCISKKFESARRLEDRRKSLDDPLKSLLARKEVIEKIAQRHKHFTDSLYQRWTNSASKVAEEATKLMIPNDDKRIPKWRIWKRSRISDKIEEMLSEIGRLQRECPGDFLVDKTPVPVSEKLDVPQITEYPTLQGCLKSILDFLKNSDIKVIVVEGIEGVGKTTILLNLNNNEEVADLFDIVIFTKVKSRQIIRNLHQVIAKRLRMDNEAIKSPSVAETIRRELENKKCLLILDNVDKSIKLEKLGIPLNKGSKVVMAIRDRHLIELDKGQRIIRVKELEREEAWKMFQDITGKVIGHPGIEPIARKVCDRCSRHPVLINKIARNFGLREIDRSWKAGLEDLKPWPQLQYPGVKELYSFLRCRYDKLKDENTQKCFLYTSLYPADRKVYSDYLVECWAAHGFLGDVNDTGRYQIARDKGSAILEDLIRVSLLDEEKGKKHVRMNDCIKQLALHISSSLDTWQSARWESKIAQKLCVPPTIQDGNMLVTLLLQKNPDLVTIPSAYFTNMNKLVLLDLYGTGIGQLPSSILALTNLKGLYLNDCRLLIMLPMEIKSLQNLEVLDIRGSGVTFIPSHIQYLTNLRCLRISYDSNHCKDENVMANHNVISGLHKLEELVIEVISYTQWSNDAEHVIQQVASLKNLSMLVCTFPSSSILQIFLEQSESWRKHVQFNSFRFFVGCESSKCHQIVDSLEYRINNYMKYCNGEMNDDLAVAQILPRTHAFDLVCHKDIRSLSSWVEAKTLNDVRSFLIERCDKMVTIVAGNLHNNIVSILPTLEHLYLDDLHHLKWAFRSPLHPKTLSNLKTLTLRNCPTLNIIFFQAANEKENQRDMLPKLEMLVLDGLQDLNIISKDKILAWPSLVSLHICNCPQLKTLPFGMEDATKLRLIIGEQQWWNSLVWTNKDEQRFQSIFTASNK